MKINYLSHAKQAMHNAHKAEHDAALYKARLCNLLTRFPRRIWSTDK